MGSFCQQSSDILRYTSLTGENPPTPAGCWGSAPEKTAPETEKETDRQTDSQPASQPARQAGRQAGRQACRQTDRQTSTQTHKDTERERQRERERQTDRQTARQTDRQAGRQTDRQTEGRRPGASFRALLFGTGEGAVCEPCRLEDSRPQPHAGECAGEALFLALAKAPFVSFGGWKKASFVSLGGWKGATFLVGSEGDVRHGRPGLKPYKPFRRPFHGNSSNCGFYVVLGTSEGKKSEKFAS